jgi:hypothetical protein
MRYILKRDLFLDQNKINEVFQNEVTWGGSLLGRLINSTIRVLKLNYDTVKIEGVNTQIKATIYEILKESLDKDLRVKLYRYRIKNFVTGIRNVSLTSALPMWDEDIDCNVTGGTASKIAMLIGTDKPDTETEDFSQTSKELTSGFLYDFFQEMDNLTGASMGDQDLKNVLTRAELDDLRNIHSTYAVELRKIRWKLCNPRKTIGGKSIDRTQQWQGKSVILDTDQKLKSEISVKNESRIFKKFADFENKRKSILEYADTTKEYGSLLGDINKKGDQSGSDTMTLVRPKELVPELRTDAISNLDNIIDMMENIMSFLGNYKPSDTNLSNLVSSGITSKIFAKWSSDKNWIKNLFISDSKSLRIFLSTFITSLYGIRFDGGEDLYGKIRAMKLNETLATRSQLQQIYLQRREFISDLPTFIKYFQSILAFLIGLKKSNKFVEREHNQIYQLLKKFFSFLYDNKTQLMSGLVEGPKLAGPGIEDVPGPVKSNQQDTNVVDTNKDKDEDESDEDEGQGDRDEDDQEWEGDEDEDEDTSDQEDSDENTGEGSGENIEGSPNDDVATLYNLLFIQQQKNWIERGKGKFKEVGGKFLKFFEERDLITERIDIAKYELTRDDEKEFKKLEAELSSGKFTLTRKKASDAIIRLLNLLTTAYELFAVEYIPSGRPGGRVSMKTFKQYQYLGAGKSPERQASSTGLDAGGTAVIPSYGPWAQSKVYQKFQDAMRELLEDQELRKIFANINFSYPGSEDKFNEPNESVKYKILNEAVETNERRMGPAIFELLEDLITPAKCGDGLTLISNVKRKYFGLEPLKNPDKPTNSADNYENDDTKNVNTLNWQDRTFTETKDLDGYNSCLPVDASKDFDNRKINDSSTDILEDRQGRQTVVYLTSLDTNKVPRIKTSFNNIPVILRPVKLTFKTPLVANQYHEENRWDFTGYMDYSDVSKLNPSIYYGYCYLSKNLLWLFYVPLEDPIKKIHYQKMVINEMTFEKRRNPNANKPPKEESHLIKPSILHATKKIEPYLDRIESTTQVDLHFYENIFQSDLECNGRPEFAEYMKSILEDNPTNQDRLGEITKI